MDSEKPADTSRDGERIDKASIILAIESAVGSLMGLRLLMDTLIPDGAVWQVGAEQGCAHEHRAPSDPSFCLDCEEEVGVSAGFTGGDGS